MAKVRHMPAAFANQANGGSPSTTSASASGSSATAQQKPSPHQGQFFRIPKVSPPSSNAQTGVGATTQPSFEDILGSGDNVMRSPKSNKLSKHPDSNRSPKKDDGGKTRNHQESGSKEKNQESGVTITKLSVSSGGGGDKDNRPAARADERREKESSHNHYQHREKQPGEKSRDHHNDKSSTHSSRMDRDKKEYLSKEKENHRSHHAAERDRSRDERDERRDRGVNDRQHREDRRKPLDATPKKASDSDIQQNDGEACHERRKSLDSCKPIKDRTKSKDGESKIRPKESSTLTSGIPSSSVAAAAAPSSAKNTKQPRLETSTKTESSSLVAPLIPGLTITPVAKTPAAAPAAKHSPDLQKLLSNLGTNIIPISEESKPNAAGLVIQPVASNPPVAPLAPTTALSNVKSSPRAAATAPTSPASAAFDSSLFFKLPAPVEINNAQLKQPNGAGFFKLPPGTTKYIEENKQRKMQPAAAPAPQPLKPPATVDAAALVMATALQNAVLQKMKEPLNGLTLNDLIKSGLVSQTTAGEKQAEALKKTEDAKQREKLKRKIEAASAVQTLPVEQAKRKCPQPVSNPTPDWTPLDLMVLTERMKRSIPTQDNVQFAVTESRMDWSQVAFSKYSSSECRSKWTELSQKVRQFRTLSELLSDTQDLIKTSTPGTISASATILSQATAPNVREPKKLKHPDLPKKPLTPYMRYLVDKLKIVKERYPELSHGEASKQITEKWHSLSEEKRQKLKDVFDSEMVEYQRKLEQFHRDHPEAKSHKAPAIVPIAVPKEPENLKSSESSKNLPPMDLSALPSRIKEYVELSQDKMAQTVNPPSEKPPNNGYALFAKICQIDLEPAALSFKESMSEMVKRWQVLTEDHRKLLNESAKTIKNTYDNKFGRLNLSKVNVDKNGNVVVSAMPVENKKPKKSLQTIPIPMEKLNSPESRDSASNEITPIELYKKEKFARLKEDYPDKPDHEILRVLSKTYMELPQEDRLVWREKAKMLNEEQRQKENPKPKDKDRIKRVPRLPKRKPLPGEPKRPLMSGYSVFTNEVMSKLRENNQPKVLISVVAKQWTALPSEKKSEYKAKAAELDRKYKEEVNNFLKTLNPEQIAEYKAHLEATSKRRGRREERPEKRGLSEDSEDIEDEVVLNKDADEESLSESDMELRHSSAADCTSSEDEAPPPLNDQSYDSTKKPATDESSDEEEPAPVQVSSKAALPSMPCLTDASFAETSAGDQDPPESANVVEPSVAGGQTNQESSSENSSSDSSDSDDSDDSSDDSSDESDSD
ncbi:nucleolar transcription factor 1 [Galendromus occidentalis]|uniref:Nucleolar transcription factor 1 n=1 Tax=Galendromus occidentalis TaxID=34638 RepID=A0AAJ6QXY4_9ACAR|nr:nucleolar transcription factor 1 [Galendromus occidentalis]